MKLFCVSDIHSFATELISSLKAAGFDRNNKEHILLVLGDVFDRGSESIKVYEFLKSVPKSRRILIHGNHDYLLFSLLKKKTMPEQFEFSNGTVNTICQLANDIMKKKDPDFFADVGELECATLYGRWCVSDEAVNNWNNIRIIAKEHPAVKWLKSKEWKNYWEYDKYIFVHCFIPVNLKPEMIKKFGMMSYGLENPACFEYNKDWREAIDDAWEQASWGCPWSSFAAGLFDEEAKKGKVLVCGHWYTDDFFRNLKNNESHDGEIYFSKHLIGIDGGTMSKFNKETLETDLIHHQNVLVIDGDKCYNEAGQELKEIPETPIIETVSMTEEEYKEYLKNEKEESGNSN